MNETLFMDAPFSPMSFWFLNHDLQNDELRWQLREMKNKGFKGVFIHPRDGLTVPYQSELWWEKVKLILDTCEELGLHPWLYDEDPFPSGGAGGQVIHDRPQYKAREINMHMFDSQGGELEASFPMGRLVKVFAVRMEEGTPSRDWLDLTADTGILRSTWTPGYVHHHSYYPPYEDAGNPHWRSKTSDPHFALKCTVPSGTWKIFTFVDNETDWDDPWGGYPDLLNPQAVRHFMDLTHEKYAERYGELFGKLIPGIFTDEPKVLGVVSWTEDFPAYFTSLFGYDIRDRLPDLFVTIDDHTAQVRHDYRLAVSRLFNESFVIPIAQWCKERAMIFTGHISPEEDPVAQTRYTPYLMSMLKHFQIPGTDLITGHIGSATHPLLHLGPKIASSAAHHTGKSVVFAEAFGSNSWGLDLQDMRKMTDWLGVMGVTDIVTHGQFYSIEGLRKKEAPPSQFYQSSHWPYFGTYLQHLSDMSEALKEGVHRCRLLVYYPQASFSAYFPDRTTDLVRCSTQFGLFVHKLLSHQWDFDFTDEETLLRMNIQDGKLHGPHEQYDVLLMSACDYLESGAASFCERFVSLGGQVWMIGEAPRIVQSAGSDASVHNRSFYSRMTGLDSLLDELEDQVQRDWLIQGAEADPGSGKPLKDIYMHERVLNGKTRVFLLNAGAEWKNGIIRRSADVSGNPVLRFQLPPYGSLLADLTEDHADVLLEDQMTFLNHVAYQAETEDFIAGIDLSDNWRLSPQDDNVLTLTHWHVWDADPRTCNIPITSMPALNVMERATPVSAREQWLFCRFYSEGPVTTTKLVFEPTAWEGRCVIKVNGTQVPAAAQVRRYDAYNLEIDITDFVSESGDGVRINWVEAYFPEGGRLMEPFRVYGEFHVKLPYLGFPPAQLCYGVKPKISRSLQPWDEIGYPHYAGTMYYEKEIVLGEQWLDENSAHSIYLYVESVHDIARLNVNGVETKTRYCDPFVWDLKGVLVPGVNRLNLEIANSSVTLLEGNRKASGMLGRIRLVQIPGIQT